MCCHHVQRQAQRSQTMIRQSLTIASQMWKATEALHHCIQPFQLFWHWRFLKSIAAVLKIHWQLDKLAEITLVRLVKSEVYHSNRKAYRGFTGRCKTPQSQGVQIKSLAMQDTTYDFGETMCLLLLVYQNLLLCLPPCCPPLTYKCLAFISLSPHFLFHCVTPSLQSTSVLHLLFEFLANQTLLTSPFPQTMSVLHSLFAWNSCQVTPLPPRRRVCCTHHLLHLWPQQLCGLHVLVAKTCSVLQLTALFSSLQSACFGCQNTLPPPQLTIFFNLLWSLCFGFQTRSSSSYKCVARIDLKCKQVSPSSHRLFVTQE
jgi:hypothetical protein